MTETWRTDETGRTDGAGRWGARGFHGRYLVTVTSGGRVHEVELRLAPDADGEWMVVLPE